MRLREVERGDRLVWRFLIWFISLVSEMRLPDAARIVQGQRPPLRPHCPGGPPTPVLKRRS